MSSALVTTIAGQGSTGFTDGVGGAAAFKWPQGLGVDAAGTVAIVVSREMGGGSKLITTGVRKRASR